MTQVFDTGHKDALHDAQLDYYGSRLATASSDHLVRIWDVSSLGSGSTFMAELDEHDGPVWQVAWGHPSTKLLASCGFDGKVVVWREHMDRWDAIHREACESAVNCVAFAPGTGVTIAAGLSDGSFRVIRFNNGQWSSELVKGSSGINGLAWVGDGLVLARENHKLDFWRPVHGEWHQVQGAFAARHRAPVMDVSYLPPKQGDGGLLVSGCRRGSLIFWKQQADEWVEAQEVVVEGSVWRVSWADTGSILAAAHGDGQTSLFKKDVSSDQWTAVQEEHQSS